MRGIRELNFSTRPGRQNQISDIRRQAIVLPPSLGIRRFARAFHGFQGIVRGAQCMVGHVRGCHGMSDRTCHRGGRGGDGLACHGDRIQGRLSRVTDRGFSLSPGLGHAQRIPESLIELPAEKTQNVVRAGACPAYQLAMHVLSQRPATMFRNESSISHVVASRPDHPTVPVERVPRAPRHQLVPSQQTQADEGKPHQQEDISNGKQQGDGPRVEALGNVADQQKRCSRDSDKSR